MVVTAVERRVIVVKDIGPVRISQRYLDPYGSTEGVRRCRDADASTFEHTAHIREHWPWRVEEMFKHVGKQDAVDRAVLDGQGILADLAIVPLDTPFARTDHSLLATCHRPIHRYRASSQPPDHPRHDPGTRPDIQEHRLPIRQVSYDLPRLQ